MAKRNIRAVEPFFDLIIESYCPQEISENKSGIIDERKFSFVENANTKIKTKTPSKRVNKKIIGNSD